MTESPPTLLERLERAPGRGRGIVAALLAVAVFLVAALPAILLDDTTDEVTLVRVFLGLNAIALLGFLPLLHAVHAVVARPARPAWLLLAAYLVLLVRPAVLAIDVVNAPITLGGPAVPFVLLGTTGVAAGLAAVALQPTVDARGEPIGSPVRSLVLGVGGGLVVALTLFAFAPYVAPVSAMGIAVALSLRKPPLPPDPWEQRAADGVDGHDDALDDEARRDNAAHDDTAEDDSGHDDSGHDDTGHEPPERGRP